MLELKKIRMRSVSFSSDNVCPSLPCPAMVVEESEKAGYRMPLTDPENIPKFTGGQLPITTAGHGVLNVGEKTYDCVPGTAFLHTDCDPQVSYLVPPESEEEWRFLWINFAGEASERIIREINAVYGYFFVLKNDSLKKYLKAFLKHSGARFFISPLEGAKIFLDLRNELCFPGKNLQDTRPGKHLSREMEKELACAFCEPISTAALAQRLGLSREHMSRIFHKETGQTLQKYRAGQRLSAALNLLEKSNCSCKEISDYCNYGSYSSFYRAFMAIYHISPEDYRKKFGNVEKKRKSRRHKS